MTRIEVEVVVKKEKSNEIILLQLHSTYGESQEDHLRYIRFQFNQSTSPIMRVKTISRTKDIM
jgi:hypothetical protein